MRPEPPWSDQTKETWLLDNNLYYFPWTMLLCLCSMFRPIGQWFHIPAESSILYKKQNIYPKRDMQKITTWWSRINLSEGQVYLLERLIRKAHLNILKRLYILFPIALCSCNGMRGGSDSDTGLYPGAATVAGSTVVGAGTGAAIGALAGPPGAAIGAVVSTHTTNKIKVTWWHRVIPSTGTMWSTRTTKMKNCMWKMQPKEKSCAIQSVAPM